MAVVVTDKDESLRCEGVRNRREIECVEKWAGGDLEASALACTGLLLNRGDLENLVLDRVLQRRLERVVVEG